MLEPPNIPDDQLRARLQEAYGFTPTTIDFLPLGLDTRAGVYRVVSAEGPVYLLKAKRGGLYEASCSVPRYLRDQGIASVVAPLPTNNNALWTQIGEWTLILYPFVDGVSGWKPEVTAAQWRAIGAALRQIHDCAVPTGYLGNIRVESFFPFGYKHKIQMMSAHFATSVEGDYYTQMLRTEWRAHQATIDDAMTFMQELAIVLASHEAPLVICHADLHASNIIRADDGQVFIIDWDDVKLAPKERDFLFVGDPPTAATPDGSAFFQGYGPTEIDWVALTYYRWERIITDVIECAESVCFRDDVADVTRAREAQLFREILAEGNGMIVAAQRAMAQLPGDMMEAITRASTEGHQGT